MDPLTQGTIGAVLPQALGKKNLGVVALLGFLSGMAPDLDILIRSSTDPLLSLEYHRQFTHSLIFIPFGGLICALFLFVVFKKINPWDLSYFYFIFLWLPWYRSIHTSLFVQFQDLRLTHFKRLMAMPLPSGNWERFPDKLTLSEVSGSFSWKKTPTLIFQKTAPKI